MKITLNTKKQPIKYPAIVRGKISKTFFLMSEPNQHGRATIITLPDLGRFNDEPANEYEIVDASLENEYE